MRALLIWTSRQQTIAVLISLALLLSAQGPLFAQIGRQDLKVVGTESSRVQSPPNAAERLDPATLAKRKPTFIPPSQTTVKVWTGQGRLGGEFFTTVDEFFVSNDREDLLWWIEWTSRQNGAVKALYQVSLFPYSPASNNWQDPPGLIASGSVDEVRTDGTKQHIEIDLAQLMPSGSTSQTIPLPGERPPDAPAEEETAGQPPNETRVEDENRS